MVREFHEGTAKFKEEGSYLVATSDNFNLVPAALLDKVADREHRHVLTRSTQVGDSQYSLHVGGGNYYTITSLVPNGRLSTESAMAGWKAAVQNSQNSPDAPDVLVSGYGGERKLVVDGKTYRRTSYSRARWNTEQVEAEIAALAESCKLPIYADINVSGSEVAHVVYADEKFHYAAMGRASSPQSETEVISASQHSPQPQPPESLLPMPAGRPGPRFDGERTDGIRTDEEVAATAPRSV